MVKTPRTVNLLFFGQMPTRPDRRREESDCAMLRKKFNTSQFALLGKFDSKFTNTKTRNGSGKNVGRSAIFSGSESAIESGFPRFSVEFAFVGAAKPRNIRKKKWHGKVVSRFLDWTRPHYPLV